MKVKTTQTLYFDYDYGYFSADKPDSDKRAGKDYYVLRKGTVFEVLQGREAIEKHFGNDLFIIQHNAEVVIVDKNGSYFEYGSMEELRKSKRFEKAKV